MANDDQVNLGASTSTGKSVKRTRVQLDNKDNESLNQKRKKLE